MSPDDDPWRRSGPSPDLGTPASRLVTIVVVTGLYLILALGQNLQPFLMPPESPVGREPAGAELAKLFLTLDRAFGSAGTGGVIARSGAGQFAASDHPADQLVGALLMGEGVSSEAGMEWLAAVRQDLDLTDYLAGLATPAADTPPDPDWAIIETPDGPVVDEEAVRDAADIEAIYTAGPESLSEESRTRLVDRYGWLGETALAPDDSSEREALFDTTGWAILFIAFVSVVFIVWGVAGLTMCIIAAVMFFSGKLRRGFVRPPRGGSVFLETFAVFLAGFGLVQVVGAVVASTGATTQAATLVSMLGQWVLILTILWPVLRGVRLGDWAGAVGVRGHRSVWAEIWAGVAGYFAGVPLLVAGMILTVVLTLLSSALFGDAAPPPSNPVLELVQGADVLTLLLLISLATIWAPVVEEIVFRGAVYRHVRARVGVFGAALITALLFAYLHSYGPLMTGPLIALGFTFAMIREWRGSVIGAIVAHAIHNCTVMAIMLLAMRAMA